MLFTEVPGILGICDHQLDKLAPLVSEHTSLVNISTRVEREIYIYLHVNTHLLCSHYVLGIGLDVRTKRRVMRQIISNYKTREMYVDIVF